VHKTFIESSVTKNCYP